MSWTLHRDRPPPPEPVQVVLVTREGSDTFPKSPAGNELPVSSTAAKDCNAPSQRDQLRGHDGVAAAAPSRREVQWGPFSNEEGVPR